MSYLALHITQYPNTYWISVNIKTTTLPSFIPFTRKKKFYSFSSFLRSFYSLWIHFSQLLCQEGSLWVFYTFLVLNYSIRIELSPSTSHIALCFPSSLWDVFCPPPHLLLGNFLIAFLCSCIMRHFARVLLSKIIRKQCI